MVTAGEVQRLKLADIYAAPSAGLQRFEEILGIKKSARATPAPDGLRRDAIVALALKKNVLHDYLCTQQVDESPEQRAVVAGIEAVRWEAVERDLAAVTAAAAATTTAVRGLDGAVQGLHSRMAALERRLGQQADQSSAQEAAAQAILFPTDSQLEKHRDEPAALLAAVQEEIKPFADASVIKSVFLLKAKGGKPAPAVICCTSVAAKRALLRARNQQRGDGARVRMAPRLTPWQQQQKAAARGLFEQLKAQGATVTYHCGWQLQRRDGERWVDVPVPAAE